MICPKCGAEMKQRNGKNGPFWGCSNYPDCKGIVNIPALKPVSKAKNGGGNATMVMSYAKDLCVALINTGTVPDRPISFIKDTTKELWEYVKGLE